MKLDTLLRKHAEEEQELLRNQARELQILKRKQSARRASMKQLIDNKEKEVEQQSSKLERRAKENELSELLQEEADLIMQQEAGLSNLREAHDNKLLALRHRQKQEELQLRNKIHEQQLAKQLEPMVVRLLEDVARLARLRLASKGWLWVKKGDTFPDSRVVRDSPTSWSIEGKIPTVRNSWVVYIVTLVNAHHFEVQVKSNTSYTKRGKGYSSRSFIGRNRNKMKETPIIETKDLSEDELIGALLRVHSSIKNVSPCFRDTVCDPPRYKPCYRSTPDACPACCACCACSACGACGAHPGFYGMSSLWDNPLVDYFTEQSVKEIGIPSPYLRIIPSKEKDAVIVYHSLWGNLRYADPEIVEFLTLAKKQIPFKELVVRFGEVDLESEIITLQELGFLVREDEDIQLRQKISQRERSFSHGEIIRFLRLNVASGCNLACTYCHGVNEIEQGGKKLMPLGTAIKSIQIYTDLLLANRQNSMNIRYFGGEPLLNWTVVRNSLKYATEVADKNQLSLTLLLNTNATMLTQEMTNTLAEYKQRLTAIVSLDGPIVAHDSVRIHSNGHGSFEQTLRGIALLLGANIPLDISVTLGAHNQEHLCELIDLLLERGIHAVGIDPVRIVFDKSDPLFLADKLIEAIEYGLERDFQVSGMWEDVCERLKYGVIGSYCGGNGSELSVMPTGDIFPCQSQPIHLGTLEDVKTRELFVSDTYRKVAMRVVGNLPNCKGCEIEGMCAGGCAADAFAAENSLYGRTRYCEFLKKMTHYYFGKLDEMDL